MATTKKAMLLLVLLQALLPLTTLGSRAGPSTHHGHRKQHSPPPPTIVVSPPPAPPSSAAALVRATCNSTSYYDVCVSALGGDPSSATADVRGLSSIAVSAAAVNASGGAATAAMLANGTVQAPAADGTLLRACAAKYGLASDALAAARGSIANQDYDYAQLYVSAAAEYPQVCNALFRRQRPGAYPAELAAREDALSKLCAVSLDIIALLPTQS
jgi:pectinesterase inhibitor-like protein